MEEPDSGANDYATTYCPIDADPGVDRPEAVLLISVLLQFIHPFGIELPIFPLVDVLHG
jgi:hypothetical protein